mmetsp:Transcript_2277/g.5614  ORF Transcript_2277/g.5614 Transcript_2277/m.5614 type:complete len:204 (-) Transcript_2277:479-1090(-)
MVQKYTDCQASFARSPANSRWKLTGSPARTTSIRSSRSPCAAVVACWPICAAHSHWTSPVPSSSKSSQISTSASASHAVSVIEARIEETSDPMKSSHGRSSAKALPTTAQRQASMLALPLQVPRPHPKMAPRSPKSCCTEGHQEPNALRATGRRPEVSNRNTWSPYCAHAVDSFDARTASSGLTPRLTTRIGTPTSMSSGGAA